MLYLLLLARLIQDLNMVSTNNVVLNRAYFFIFYPIYSTLLKIKLKSFDRPV